MINIGILGSSFSFGSDIISADWDKEKAGTQTKPLVFWFSKYQTQDFDFINLANPGHGSEHYLENIIYLKQKFNVEKILIESYLDQRNAKIFLSVDNIQRMFFDTGVKYKYLSIKENIDEIEKRYTNKNSMSATPWPNNPELENKLYRYADSKEDEISWATVQQRISDDYIINGFLGIMNIYKSIQLCNLLNIKPYLWMPTGPGPGPGEIVTRLMNETCMFAQYLNDLVKQHKGMIPYFESKYDRNNVHCDNAHLNDQYQEILVRDYLIPFIEDRYVL